MGRWSVKFVGVGRLGMYLGEKSDTSGHQETTSNGKRVNATDSSWFKDAGDFRAQAASSLDDNPGLELELRRVGVGTVPD